MDTGVVSSAVVVAALSFFFNLLDLALTVSSSAGVAPTLASSFGDSFSLLCELEIYSDVRFLESSGTFNFDCSFEGIADALRPNESFC